MNRLPISIIIPTVSGEDFLRESLKILLSIAREVIVVNSWGRQEINDMCTIASQYGRLISVEDLDNKLTFAEANNLGFKEASFDKVLFLNDDIIVQHSSFLSLMDALLESDEKIGAVGAVLEHTNKNIHHAGVYYNHDLIQRDLIRGRFIYEKSLPAGTQVKSKEVPSVTGACVLMRSSVFKDAGMWNEEYRNGWEDNELMLRIHELGHSIWLCGDAILTHKQSHSPTRHDYENQNAALFLQRWVFNEKLFNMIKDFPKDES